MRKIITLGIILLFLGMTISSSTGFNLEKQSTIDVITVDDEGDGDYINIQDAVDNATNENIIKVYSGIYEPTRIDNTIILEGVSHELNSGSDTGKPVINGREGKGRLIYLSTVNDCIIQGFELYNGDFGILLIASSNNTLSENNISNCRYGIHIECILGPSTNNIVERNYITDNFPAGLFLEFADNNTIRNNIITNNGEQGILLYHSSGNKVYSNYLSHNGQKLLGPFGHAGVCVSSSKDNIIEKNSFKRNTYGVFVHATTDTFVRCNNFLGNIRKEAYGTFTSSTEWENNYWKRPRILPKPILIIKEIIYLPPPFWEIKLHRVQFDWHPAQEPYDIEV